MTVAVKSGRLGVGTAKTVAQQSRDTLPILPGLKYGRGVKECESPSTPGGVSSTLHQSVSLHLGRRCGPKAEPCGSRAEILLCAYPASHIPSSVCKLTTALAP